MIVCGLNEEIALEGFREQEAENVIPQFTVSEESDQQQSP